VEADDDEIFDNPRTLVTEPFWRKFPLHRLYRPGAVLVAGLIAWYSIWWIVFGCVAVGVYYGFGYAVVWIKQSTEERLEAY
jgi:hypothetical protein